MEQVSSMVSNGGGSVTMQRDDEYRNRIMKSKCVKAMCCVYICIHIYVVCSPQPQPRTELKKENSQPHQPQRANI